MKVGVGSDSLWVAHNTVEPRQEDWKSAAGVNNAGLKALVGHEWYHAGFMAYSFVQRPGKFDHCLGSPSTYALCDNAPAWCSEVRVLESPWRDLVRTCG